MANFINPFSVVKANEFSNEEILSYWVSFSDSKDGFVASLRPRELMPKYIIGSKGCGKTHLLRYYSFPARISHYKDDINALLKSDGYIASYSRLDGLSSMRFKQGVEDANEWRAIYNYYFELYHSIVALQTYSRVISLLGVSHNVYEVVHSLAQYIGIELEEYTINEFIEFLNQKRIAVDNEIIEFAFTKQLLIDKVRPLFSFGSLMFEIPKAFSEKISELKNVNYIYILDEYEKLRLDWQKESLNTLVYEKKNNCTIWVGARKNGYTTRNTLTGEPIHEGHEFDPVDLDDLLKRDPKKFERFSEEVFKKRLKLSDIIIKSSLEDLFEKYDEEKFLYKLGQKENLRHWKTFKDRLNTIGISQKDVEKIYDALYYVTKDDILSQKLILYMFYQQWAEHRGIITLDDLFIISQSVIKEYVEHKKHSNKRIKELLNKFKIDFLAQLAEENKEPFYLYSGFKTLVAIADCNPRIFLTLMKLIIDDALFNGKNPFEDGTKISLHSQYVGTNETAMWFLKDIEVYGQYRENLDISMNHLLNFMYVSRFCDKPTETSLCAFYHRQFKGKSNIDAIITLALNESFLVEVKNSRKDKTLGTPQKSYQINKLIATLYNLPIARRGIISISQEMMSAIFDYNQFDKFNSLLTSHKISRNAPFKSKGIAGNDTENIEPTLFD